MVSRSTVSIFFISERVLYFAPGWRLRLSVLFVAEYLEFAIPMSIPYYS